MDDKAWKLFACNLQNLNIWNKYFLKGWLTSVSVEIVDASGEAVEVVVVKFGEVAKVRLELVAVGPTPDDTWVGFEILINI